MIRISVLGITVAVLVLAMATSWSGLVTVLAGFLYCFLVWWIVSKPVVEDDDEEGIETPPHKL